MRGFIRIVVAVATGLALVPPLLMQPAQAEDPPPQLLLTGPTSARTTSTVTLTATLTQAGAALPGEVVQFQQQSGTDWVLVGSATTDATGIATISRVVRAGSTQFRAVYAGPPETISSVLGIEGTPYPTVLVIGGSLRVVDETTGVITATWRTDTGRPVQGTVRLYARPRGGLWRVEQMARTGSNGIHRFTIRPRVDTRYTLRGVAGTWWLRAASGERSVDNRPPAPPWYAPRLAPRPRALAAQRRGFGTGAYVRVYRIPQAMWNQMSGISWHRGCPVGRYGLRLIRTNYWGFDGYRHRGELVVNRHVVSKFVGALRGLYHARLPIRAMYRVDRFGYSRVSGGGNDYASMRHDNTSAFNCRWVSGNPGVRSPHSTGRAFDLNTWENPYLSNWGWLPDQWWVGHADPRVAWRTRSHPVVRILLANGFRWTYGHSDLQHFDGRVVPRGGFFTAG